MMHWRRVPAILAVTIAVGACSQWTSRSSEPLAAPDAPAAAQPEAPQPIEPEAVQAPPPLPARNDVIVLLPKPNGSIGGVVVRNDAGQELLLDKPYAGARIAGPSDLHAVTYDEGSARAEFGDAITALPGRPVTFLLYFLEGKDELTSDSESEMTQIFAEIAARPDPEVWVIGHTDAVGTVQFNDQLSLQRAEHVRDELVSRGIPADHIEVSGRGKREPLVPTSEGISEAKNRRVEISVR